MKLCHAAGFTYVHVYVRSRTSSRRPVRALENVARDAELAGREELVLFEEALHDSSASSRCRCWNTRSSWQPSSTCGGGPVRSSAAIDVVAAFAVRAWRERMAPCGSPTREPPSVPPGTSSRPGAPRHSAADATSGRRPRLRALRLGDDVGPGESRTVKASFRAPVERRLWTEINLVVEGAWFEPRA